MLGLIRTGARGLPLSALLAVGMLLGIGTSGALAQSSFSDDFNRASLGTDWTAENGSFDLSTNRLRENSGVKFSNARLLYNGGNTSTVNQYSKLQVTSLASHTWGFMLRVGGPSSDHYQIHSPNGSSSWRWERHDPYFVGLIDSCVGDGPVLANDWIGATIEGAGNDTVIQVWRWNVDPDFGGPVDVALNWGAADCVMTGDPVSPINGNTGLGIRAYTGNKTSSATADNWYGGDAPSASICGDGLVEGLEDCDDSNLINGDGCDSNCINEVCGNGVVQFGEDCDDGNLINGDGCNDTCMDEPLPPERNFSDFFNRASLGADWAVETGAFNLSSGRLRENSGQKFIDARLRYVANPTASTNQYSKLQISTLASHTWGFMLRVNGPSSDHYQVHLPSGGNEWRWEQHDPEFVARIDQCAGDVPPAANNWIGAVVQGSGNNTVVQVWRWDSDPDLAGPVDIAGNWGLPDCTMTADPAGPVDSGFGLGIRAYTGNKTTSASADNWYGGDLPVPSICGDGLLEGFEECDDSNVINGDGCDSNCILEFCGNGVLQVGEQCETDGDCMINEICDGGCSCVPAPVCGDGLLEGAEECDDNNLIDGDGCDSNCINETCGNGVVQFGEDCDDGNLANGDGCDDMCLNEPLPPERNFSDDFNRVSLGADWAVEAGSFDISSNQLRQNSGQKFINARLRYLANTTASTNQYSKLQISSLASNTWGFMLRVNGPSSDHYQVHLPSGGNEWRWEQHNPDFVVRIDQCVGDVTPDANDWIGAVVQGTGDNTMVQVWRWDTDPDLAGPVNIAGNWGMPDCTMIADPAGPVDSGVGLGIRAYTGNKTTSASADNWYGGDLPMPTVCGDGLIEGFEECDDSNLIDGDGCDSNCVIEICGNGVLQTSEQCDDGNLLNGDGCDSLCMNEPVSGQTFNDDFDRFSLGSDWTNENISFSIQSNQLASDSGLLFQNGRLRWTAGQADTADQYGKLQVSTLQSQTWGFLFRGNLIDGDHYQVHVPVGSNEWRWERHDPGFVRRIDQCVGGSPAANGDWIGATMDGNGDDTVVRVWHWSVDPDFGGAVDIDGKWGPPNCIMTANPLSPIDSGRTLGLRTYTGISNATALADNWFGGDCGPAVTQSSCGANMSGAPRILEIFNSLGAGSLNSLLDPDGVAFDSLGNVFTAACGLGPDSEGVFMRDSLGAITEIIGDQGDLMGNPLSCPVGLAVDPADTLYTVGFFSNNAFSRTSAGTITEIIDGSGDGLGNPLDGTLDIALNAAGSVFVTGFFSDNVFRIDSNGTIEQILDASGDGINGLDGPFGVAVDSLGNVYIAGFISNNVFRVTPGGVVTQIMDASGDGGGNLLNAPHDLAVGPDDSLYVTGNLSDNVFRILPGGAIRQILDSSGAGPAAPLDNPTGIAVASNGKIYVAAFKSENAFEITPGGGVTELINSSGDGVNGFTEASDFCVAVDDAGILYLAGTGTDNVYRVLLTCGDGAVQPGLEVCDDAGASATCDDDCTLPVCGDGNVNGVAGEQCEVDADCSLGMTCGGCICS